MQVRDSSDVTAVGKFSRPDNIDFKLLDCFGKTNSAFSHANGKLKGNVVTTSWIAPSICQRNDNLIRFESYTNLFDKFFVFGL